MNEPLTAQEEAKLRAEAPTSQWRSLPPLTVRRRLLATLDATRKAADGAYEAGKLDAEGEYHATLDAARADTAGIDAAALAIAAYLDRPPLGRRPIPWTPVLHREWTDWARRMAAALRTPKPEGDR